MLCIKGLIEKCNITEAKTPVTLCDSAFMSKTRINRSPELMSKGVRSRNDRSRKTSTNFPSTSECGRSVVTMDISEGKTMLTRA